jgi:hypothetical protein
MANDYDQPGANGSYNPRIDKKFIAKAERILLDPNTEYVSLDDFIAEMEAHKKD